MMRPRPPILVANPSSDLYGSSRQLLESIVAMTSAGWRVVVALPEHGPLSDELKKEGVEIRLVDFPVIRRSSAHAAGFARLLLAAAKATFALTRIIRELNPCTVYVNTVTLPWWLLAACIARKPRLCHVHEAEVRDSRPTRTALALPLMLADVVVANSRTTLDVLCGDVPALQKRTTVIYNGVSGPPGEPELAGIKSPYRIAVIGRLSPRKAPDVALEAVSVLRAHGRDVVIELCGSAFEGYEWFETNLRIRASQTDLNGAVTFAGYMSTIWPLLSRSDLVVAPSLGESFGNAVVESQLARRPVVATAMQGHLETIKHGETGLLVPPSDSIAMANAIALLMDDRHLADKLASQGHDHAVMHFSPDRYRAELALLLQRLCK